ncbi:MAG: hypothetical protein ACFFDN_45360, partial [Candidatus Hodarchaeota archaeon]
ADRFIETIYVYQYTSMIIQGKKRMKFDDFIKQINNVFNEYLIQPDINIFLNVDPNIAINNGAGDIVGRDFLQVAYNLYLKRLEIMDNYLEIKYNKKPFKMKETALKIILNEYQKHLRN